MKAKNKLAAIKEVVADQKAAGEAVIKLSARSMDFLLERAGQATRTEHILECSDLEDDAKILNIEDIYYD